MLPRRALWPLPLRSAPVCDRLPLLQAPEKCARPGRAGSIRCPGSPSSFPSLTSFTSSSASWIASASSITRRELLQIQVLDDSTDETRAITEGEVQRAQRRGLRHRARPSRGPHRLQGRRAQGGARVPARGNTSSSWTPISSRSPICSARPSISSPIPGIGMIQSRWGHVNRTYSLLTRVQAMFLDGHLRPRADRPQPRRAFLQFQRHRRPLAPHLHRESAAAGSTTRSPRTSTSATAPSSRAGDSFTSPDLVTPAELPVEINGFKSQQHRWTKGSIQTCKKILARHLARQSPAAHQARGDRPSHLELRLPAARLPLRAPAPHQRRPRQWHVAHRPAGYPHLRGRLALRLRLLRLRPARPLSAHLDEGNPPPSPASRPRHRPRHQQRPRRPRGALQSLEPISRARPSTASSARTSPGARAVTAPSRRRCRSSSSVLPHISAWS